MDICVDTGQVPPGSDIQQEICITTVTNAIIKYTNITRMTTSIKAKL